MDDAHDDWMALDHMPSDAMLAEIATYDPDAAKLAKTVWEYLDIRGTATEQAVWCNQLAKAVLSYRGSFRRSRIGAIAAAWLRTHGVPPFA